MAFKPLVSFLKFYLCNLFLFDIVIVWFLLSFWFAMFEEAEHSLHAEYYSKMGQKV